MRSDVRSAIARSLSFLLVLGALVFLIWGTAAGKELNAWANRQVSGTNAALLRLAGVDAHVDGTYIHTSTFSVLIVDRCNGLMALVLLIAGSLTLPVRPVTRLLGCVGATVFVCVLNQARLGVEMVYGSLYPETFDLLEEVIMRIVYALSSLAAFWIWARVAVRKEIP